MSRGFLLIDGNNIAHVCNNTKPLSIGNQPVQAIYGMLRTMRPMMTTFSMLTPVVLWDGASWRKKMFEGYKESREKEPTKKYELEAAKLREDLKKQTPFIKEALRHLGVRQMMAINYEADDLAAMIVKKAVANDKRVVMITGDKDWVQLLGPNTGWIDPVRGDRLTEKTLPDKLGYHPEKKKIGIYDGKEIAGWMGVPSPAAWLEMKCLMGDTSDDIPGVGGIGEKGAIEFVHQYKTVPDFINQVVFEKSIDEKSLPKRLRDLAVAMEKKDNYYRNRQLMDLNYKGRPAPINLNTDAGAFNLEAFEDLCGRFQFNTLLSQIGAWAEPFNPMKVAA